MSDRAKGTVCFTRDPIFILFKLLFLNSFLKLVIQNIVEVFSSKDSGFIKSLIFIKMKNKKLLSSDRRR